MSDTYLKYVIDSKSETLFKQLKKKIIVMILQLK